MEFKQYPSLENHYQFKFINMFLNAYPELKDEQYILTEKIHGANFQLYFEPQKQFAYGKRTSFLKSDEKFYDVHSTVTKYTDMIDRIQKYCNMTNQTVRLFGEYYGKGVQKGVDYGDEQKIAFFDIYIDNRLQDQQLFHMLCSDTMLKLPTVPVIAIVDSLDKALEFNTEFDSKLTEKSDNICEGIVIKPYKKVYFYNHSLFYIKKKNDKFKEKQRVPKPPREVNEAVQILNLEFRSYCVEERVQSVFSKHGEIERPQQIPDYIKLVMEDAKEDFLKDHGEKFNKLDEKEKKQVLNVGSTIVNFLKKYL